MIDSYENQSSSLRSPEESIRSTVSEDVDSDLNKDTDTSSVKISNRTNKAHQRRSIHGNDPNEIIGGTNVLFSSPTNESLTGNTSTCESDLNDNDSDKEDSTPSYIINDSNNERTSWSTDELKKEHKNKSTHKIFTFSLPFGGTSMFPSLTLPSIVSSIIPGDTEDDDDGLDKHKIKEKLKRSDSITSVEEMALFSDTKGIDNVRARAFKKTFELESLKHTLNNIRSSPGDSTYDGYETERLESIWNELEGDILIMGGYRGSILRDTATNRRVWIPIKAGLNFRKVDLLIGPTDEDEREAQKKIRPDKMLSHIGPVDISKRLIKKLRSNPNVNLINYGYDWRLSLDIAAEQLQQKLQERYDAQKVKKGTFIIAHSMGGLIAHKVLQDNTNLIRGIIYVGAPSECSNILGPLKFGDEVLMNKTILSKEANFFMRSSFYFLPTSGSCFVNKKTYRKYKLDFFDPKLWVKLGLSPVVDEDRKKLEEQKEEEQHNHQSLKEDEQKMAKTEDKEYAPQPGISTEVKDLLAMINPISMIRSLSGSNPSSSSNNNSRLKMLDPTPLLSKLSFTTSEVMGLKEGKQCQEEEQDLQFVTPYDQCIDYLKRTLKRAKHFLESLEHIPGKNYPPLVMVYSKAVPTVRGVKINGLEDIKLGNYDDFYYGPGDGVVHHKWLLPERKGFPVAAKINSNCGHVSLLSDLDSMAKAFISITDAEKKLNTTSSCK